MNRPAVADMLRVPDAAYTMFVVSDDVVDVWTAALGDFDAPIVREIMGKWVRENDRPPTVHAIVEGCRDEVRRRGQDRRRQALPSSSEINVRRAKGTFALIREALAAAREGDPFTGPELVEIARSRDLIAEPERLRCRCVEGFVTLHDGTVEPCDRCNSPAHDRWTAGAYRGIMGPSR